MRITPLLLLVLLSGCGKHEKPPMKGSACDGTSCGITMTPAITTGTPPCPKGYSCSLVDGGRAINISQSCDGCSNSNIVETGSSETAFQRDYAVLRPQVDECEKYAHAGDMDRLRECIVRVAPLANKAAAESNADETIAANSTAVELLAMENDVLAFQIRQQMDEIDKGIDKLSHNRKRPSRISP